MTDTEHCRSTQNIGETVRISSISYRLRIPFSSRYQRTGCASAQLGTYLVQDNCKDSHFLRRTASCAEIDSDFSSHPSLASCLIFGRLRIRYQCRHGCGCIHLREHDYDDELQGHCSRRQKSFSELSNLFHYGYCYTPLLSLSG
jgi:hypothetical protein